MTPTTYLVIRSSGERTLPVLERVFEHIAIKGEREVVSISPLGRSLQHTLAHAKETRAKWTVICDADVIADPIAVRNAIAAAHSMPRNYFVLSMTIDDWIFGSARTGGVRIYRNAYCEPALEALEEVITTARPESSMIRAMADAGYSSARTDLCGGIHDRFQWHQDYYRKGYFFAHKHVNRLPALVARCRELEDTHREFRAVLLGLADGLLGHNPGADVAAIDSAQIASRLEDIALPELANLTRVEIEALAQFHKESTNRPVVTCSWRTDPLPTDLRNQWNEFRRLGYLKALRELRQIYDRVGYRQLARSLYESLSGHSSGQAGLGR